MPGSAPQVHDAVVVPVDHLGDGEGGVAAGDDEGTWDDAFWLWSGPKT